MEIEKLRKLSDGKLNFLLDKIVTQIEQGNAPVSSDEMSNAESMMQNANKIRVILNERALKRKQTLPMDKPREGDKCPVCQGDLKFIDDYDNKGPMIIRKYKCIRCRAIVGSPTDYSLCKIFGIIFKDTVLRQCRGCPKKDERELEDKLGKRCVHFDRWLDPSEVELKQVGGTGKMELVLVRR